MVFMEQTFVQRKKNEMKRVQFRVHFLVSRVQKDLSVYKNLCMPCRLKVHNNCKNTRKNSQNRSLWEALIGAGYGSRTRLASLGSWSNTDIPTLQLQNVL